MKSDRAQVAHLMRRAGFGATPSELDYFTQNRTYESIVEELVNPENTEEIDDRFINRYYSGEGVPPYVGKWLFRMINTKRPLEELSLIHI